MNGNAIQQVGGEEIDRLRQRVAELEAEQKTLRRVSRLRTALIMVAAHDLRSPMTSLIGYVELMSVERLGPLPQSFRRPLNILQRNLQWLRRLTDHLCALGHVEEPVQLVPTELPKIIDSAVAEIRAFAETQDRLLTTSIAKVPEILGDGAQLHFVLVNLLVAAVKRSQPKQEIEITIDMTCANKVRLAIRDHGALPELVRRLFAEGGGEQILAHQDHLDASALRLALAWEVMCGHGGQLLVEEGPSGLVTTLLFEPRR
jgi:signal transduction histidine kinase